MTRVYLDNNSTTRMLPEVQEAIALMARMGASNPSSSQSSGDASRRSLRQSRAAVAHLIGCDPENVFFTSSGTEANNWVLQAAFHKSHSRNCRIVTSPIEHSSILRTCEALENLGATVDYLPVNDAGRVDTGALKELLGDPVTLVSVQWVNNETGVIQPIKLIAEECSRRGIPFHTDAAQAVGKLPIDLREMPADYLTLTAHKWHGPAGIGAVFARNHRGMAPLLFGGGQEQGLRPGTENMLGIAGMGRAAELRSSRMPDVCEHMRRLRDEFERQLRQEIPGLRINGELANRICNTSNVLFPDVDGQAMVAQLDLKGIACSQGSACESMRPEPSHVLRAMGLSEDEAYACIRFSFSELNSQAEVSDAVRAICEVYHTLTGLSRELTRDKIEA